MDKLMKKGYIVLENGQIFEGTRFGYDGDAIGELVFSTSAVGYIEALTDQCYTGQILMQTFPLIGNYGWINSDAKGRKITLSAYVVREWCETPSNFRCESDLDKVLKDNCIPGIYGVDTRQLTKIIRENGVMNAAICDDPAKIDLQMLSNYKVKSAVSEFGIDEKVYEYKAENAQYNVTVINYGSTDQTVESLLNRNCNVKVVPFNTSAADILKDDPSGIVLSDGAGDPTQNTECIKEIKEMLGKKPIFAVSLGHQMLALANGMKINKLKYGHRGANQPVKYLKTGKTYITAQNHSFAVDEKSITNGAEVLFVNGNDGTCEGIEYSCANAISVQFIPQSGCNTMDTEALLYGQFIKMLENK